MLICLRVGQVLTLTFAFTTTVSQFTVDFALTHTHSLAQSTFQTNRVSLSLIFSCIASIASCISSPLLNLDFLPGPILGVGEKRRKQTSLKSYYFARLRSQTVPRAEGSCFLGFTPSCRSAAGGPAPLLIKRRFPPGSPCGVRRKRANALSHLCLTLLCLLLFLFVFAQTCTAQDAHHLLKPLQGVEPKERVLFCHCFC